LTLHANTAYSQWEHSVKSPLQRDSDSLATFCRYTIIFRLLKQYRFFRDMRPPKNPSDYEANTNV